MLATIAFLVVFRVLIRDFFWIVTLVSLMCFLEVLNAVSNASSRARALPNSTASRKDPYANEFASLSCSSLAVELVDSRVQNLLRLIINRLWVNY